jgi:hypothetical protein
MDEQRVKAAMDICRNWPHSSVNYDAPVAPTVTLPLAGWTRLVLAIESKPDETEPSTATSLHCAK